MAKQSAMLDETDDLFPELEMDDPKHKAVFAAARKFNREKSERAGLLTTSKKKCDAAEENLIELMHKAKLTKFKFRGIVVEIFPGQAKADVKIETEADDDVEGDDDK